MDLDTKKPPETGPSGPEGPQNRKPNSAAPQPPLRGIMAWGVILFMVLVMLSLFVKNQDKSAEMNYSPDFQDYVKQGKIAKVEIINDLSSGTAYAKGTLGAGETINGYATFRVNLPPRFEDDIKMLKDSGVPVIFPPQNPYFWQMIHSVLPVLLIFGLLYFVFMRQIRSAGHGALSFGKSRAKLLNRDMNKVTFENVAGIDEAKEEVQEIVEFLKDPKRFQHLGGRIPKGVLLMGPPGTGKTLLAKAIAGEADVPFFSISGSDFVEMFVGVGASRVRDMFAEGKKNAPCIIFVDEIDAVGRSRFAGIGGGHDEREQTLNALLVQMDGFETSEGVIILAATNRPDVLDPALLRPGRFDRQIVIDLPMLDGREQILKLHARGLKLTEDAELRRIARGTPGFSGADLANLLNEAALLAARNGKDGIETEDMEEARDKVRWGRERRSRAMGDKDKRITAYHEAGHALVMQVLKECEPLHKITIIPRGVAYLGATMQLPEKDRYLEGKKELLAMLASFMGGRLAEEIFMDDITSGASSDLKEATRIARLMVCHWGMSDIIGPQTFGQNEEHLFLGREVTRSQDYSEATAQRIDAEVKRILSESYEKARTIIEENREKLIMIADRLLEAETIDGIEVEEIVEFGYLLTEERRAERMKAREVKEAADNLQKTDKVATDSENGKLANPPEAKKADRESAPTASTGSTPPPLESVSGSA
ncbi:MAG: ATP-dependent zinc metalloprotease FtsH [Verrucomicrobia bacterium]|nr:ATP-dependent zinc metalloprotease FtsH [Verrucomicrobiota bacterium]